jgi:hypothetical protein
VEEGVAKGACLWIALALALALALACTWREKEDYKCDLSKGSHYKDYDVNGLPFDCKS